MRWPFGVADGRYGLTTAGRDRAPARVLGAEGATAPETLRQKDRTVDDALERSRQSLAGSPKE
jgi:hypothetical protein